MAQRWEARQRPSGPPPARQGLNAARLGWWRDPKAPDPDAHRAFITLGGRRRRNASVRWLPPRWRP
jgi:hypothetical protein